MTAAGAALLGATVSSSAARRTRSDPLARRRGTAGPRAYWVIGIKLVCSWQLTPKCSDCAGVMKLVALPLRSAWRKQDTAAQHLPAAKQKHVSCDETPLAHGPLARTPGRTRSQDRGAKTGISGLRTWSRNFSGLPVYAHARAAASGRCAGSSHTGKPPTLLGKRCGNRRALEPTLLRKPSNTGQSDADERSSSSSSPSISARLAATKERTLPTALSHATKHRTL